MPMREMTCGEARTHKSRVAHPGRFGPFGAFEGECFREYRPALYAGVHRSRDPAGGVGEALRGASALRRSPRRGLALDDVPRVGSLVDRFRAGLASLGVKRGDKVAVISQNRLEWVVGAHAVYSLGASYVPMYEAQLDKEWQYILADSGSNVCLVSSAAIEARVRRLTESLPALEHIVSFEGDAPGSYAGFLARGASHPDGQRDPGPVRPRVPHLHVGDDGQPQGRLSHALQPREQRVRHPPAPRVGPDDRERRVPSLGARLRGMRRANTCIATAHSTAICGDPAKLAQFIGEVKPTVLLRGSRVWNRIHAGDRGDDAHEAAGRPVDVPTRRWPPRTSSGAASRSGPAEWAALKLAEKLVFPKVRAAFGGRLRFAASGAAALSLEVAEFIENLGIGLYEGYGMTESSGGTTASRSARSASARSASRSRASRIEIDKSVVGATGDMGEVVIYGHGIMTGYHNLDDATRQAIGARRRPSHGRPRAARRRRIPLHHGAHQGALQARERKVRRPRAARGAAHPEHVHPPVRHLRRGPAPQRRVDRPGHGRAARVGQDAGHRGRRRGAARRLPGAQAPRDRGRDATARTSRGSSASRTSSSTSRSSRFKTAC